MHSQAVKSFFTQVLHGAEGRERKPSWGGFSPCLGSLPQPRASTHSFICLFGPKLHLLLPAIECIFSKHPFFWIFACVWERSVGCLHCLWCFPGAGCGWRGCWQWLGRRGQGWSVDKLLPQPPGEEGSSLESVSGFRHHQQYPYCRCDRLGPEKGQVCRER